LRDLPLILHRVYDAAGYADYIDGGQPAPPLSVPDAEWAALLRRASDRCRTQVRKSRATLISRFRIALTRQQLACMLTS
jgi:hypothetical protein